MLKSYKVNTSCKSKSQHFQDVLHQKISNVYSFFCALRASCPFIESAGGDTRLEVEQTGLCEIVFFPKISIGSARLVYSTAGLLYWPGRLANRADLGNRSEQMYIEPQLKMDYLTNRMRFLSSIFLSNSFLNYDISQQ